MDRVSGWYKRETQWVLLSIGLALAVALNIDSLGMARDLATNNALRQTLIARVDALYPNQKPAELSKVDLGNQIKGLSELIGWTHAEARRKARVVRDLTAEASNDLALADDAARRNFVVANIEQRSELKWDDWALILLGWIFTGFAVSLGAPFWFDLLNKFMLIRSTVKPYEKSLPDGSADRGPKVPYADPLAPALAQGADPLAPALAQGAVRIEAGFGPAAIAPITASLRIAFDLNGADPKTLAFSSDSTEVAVPPDGFLELPLSTGVPHQLFATATHPAVGSVSWKSTMLLTPDDEAKPLTAVLA